MHWNFHPLIKLLYPCPLPSFQDPLPLLRQYSFREVKKATHDFTNIISWGSHGNSYYKAQFSDGLVAAVKEISIHQDKKAFFQEVQFLWCLHHRHLITFRGFSAQRRRFLIFDYMQNGSLKDYLHNPIKTPLSWRTRFGIVANVASALEYLLFFCDPPVYDISVNLSNLLLDENLVVKLSDIGILQSNGGSLKEANAGCFGAILTGQSPQNCRGVTFQLGVLILELITGQSLGTDGTNLVKWVQENSSQNMVDIDLGNSYNSDELEKLLLVAKTCITTDHGSSSSREKVDMSLRQILRFLETVLEETSSYVN